MVEFVVYSLVLDKYFDVITYVVLESSMVVYDSWFFKMCLKKDPCLSLPPDHFYYAYTILQKIIYQNCTFGGMYQSKLKGPDSYNQDHARVPYTLKKWGNLIGEGRVLLSMRCALECMETRVTMCLLYHFIFLCGYMNPLFQSNSLGFQRRVVLHQPCMHEIQFRIFGDNLYISPVEAFPLPQIQCIISCI